MVLSNLVKEFKLLPVLVSVKVKTVCSPFLMVTKLENSLRILTTKIVVLLGSLINILFFINTYNISPKVKVHRIR